MDNIFPPAAPFNTEEYRAFGRHLLSNLMGGLGFFHGDSKVDLSHAEAYEETSLDFWKEAADAMTMANITVTQPLSLLSHSPSRPVFPHGILWDEGFHLLPVVEWDFDHAVTVFKSWLHRMDNDGWIPREQVRLQPFSFDKSTLIAHASTLRQILGPEARSKVAPEFQVQYPHIANPPTFIALLLPVILDKVTGQSTYIGHPSKHLSSPAESKAMLQELFVLLGRHYLWFRRTQPGNMTEGVYPRPDDAGTTEAYRWRGRTPGHNLASGLDDYPRAEPPHPGELHVDALSWVAASALALNRLAEHLNHKDDAARYARHAEDARHNLDALHWSEAAGAYCDTTVVPPPEGGAGPGDFSHVCHLGYVSLFPFLLGLLPPDHAHLPRLIDLLADRSANGLWSDHGLRSLRPADEHYGKDEDYWRGAVWMNINVLAVQRLAELGSGVGWAAPGVNETDQVQQLRKRSAKLAIDLRQNVVRTVHDEWRRTGFVWEQYGDRDGKGRRSRAFTGWTACVILLLRMFLEGGGGSGSSAGASSGWSVALAALAVVGLVAAAGAMRHRLLGLYRNLTAVVSNRARGRFRQLPQEETDDWHVLQPLAGRS